MNAKVASDSGEHYELNYTLNKAKGLVHLSCTCPGAEKGYFCRHMKDFVSGELRFLTQMPEREKVRTRARLQDSLSDADKSLQELVVETIALERELAAMQDEFDDWVTQELRRSIALRKLQTRAGGFPRRWEMMVATFNRVMDALEAEFAQEDSDVLTRHHDADTQRLANNRKLRQWREYREAEND